MFAFLLLSFLSGQVYELVPSHPLSPLPEKTTQFLQSPAALEVDTNNHVYVVDWVARVVFHWDEKGQFVNVIGTPGQGPGEFGFSNQGGPQGYIRTLGEYIYVYDGAKNSVLKFDRQGQFQSSQVLELKTGRTNDFYVLNNGAYVVANQNFMKQIPTRALTLYGKDGTLVKDLIEIADTTFARENDGTRVTGITIKAYSGTMASSYNAEKGELIAAFTGEPAFTILNEMDEQKIKYNVGLVQQDVTNEDKDEYNELPFIKNNPFFKTTFPEKKSFFDGILPVSNEGFLVFSITPHSRKATGLFVDRKGKTLGKFTFDCGEGGSLQGSRGRIFGIYLDSEDEFSISELKLKQK